MLARASRELIVGVDLGGTKIATVLATGGGEVLARGYRPTAVDLGPQGVLAEIASTIRDMLSSAEVSPSQVHGIGIAAAGIIDSHRGRVVVSPNLPDWHDVPLAEAIQERFGVPVRTGNDANLAALGEWYFGVDRQVTDLVYVTVSTGIGGGIIAGGKLYRGISGAAGEIGHMTVDVDGPPCRCGSNGCWEALASGRALAGAAVQEIGGGTSTSIAELAGGDMEKVDAKLVFLASQQG
ncbi:MAG: ROK family protein, partial [Chloroflexota bacterium]